MNSQLTQQNHPGFKSPIVETVAAASNAMLGANNPLARLAIESTLKAIYPTREQNSFLDLLGRKSEIDKDKFGSFSEVIKATTLGEFSDNGFSMFDTEGARAVVASSRAKLGINNNTNFQV